MNRYRVDGKLSMDDAVEAGDIAVITVTNPQPLSGELPAGTAAKETTVRLQCKGPPPSPSNPPEAPQEPIPVMLEFDAPDLDTALQWGSEEIESRADLLAVLTLNRIEIHPMLNCVEITLGKREGLRSVHIGEQRPKPLVLPNDLFRHVMGGTAFKGKLSPKLVGSFRWFRKGLSAVFPEDAFLSYWIALEMIAAEFAVGESRFMFCPRCQTHFQTCPNCGESTEMRPQASQGIIAMFRDHLSWPRQRFRDLNTTRSKLMHGNKAISQTFRQELISGTGHLHTALLKSYEVLLGLPENQRLPMRLLSVDKWPRLYPEFNLETAQGEPGEGTHEQEQ